MTKWVLVAGTLLLCPVVALAQQTEDPKLLQTKLDVCKWQLDTTSNQLSQALAQANGRVDALQKQLAAAKTPEPTKEEKPVQAGQQ
jgi:hypothetical protein